MDDLEAALEWFAGGFSGEILIPGNSGFDEARAVWNAIIDRRPLLLPGAKTPVM